MNINKKILKHINSKKEKEFDPYYLYDTQEIKNQCRLFREIEYKDKSIHFATMANINHQFLSIIKEEKVNIFVNSVTHMNDVIKCGFKADEIIFTSSALTKSVMQYINDNGVTVNLDSPGQLEQWLSMFPDTKVGIRCNIGDAVAPYSNHAGPFIGKKSRLGFTLEEIDKIEDKSVIMGLHMYVGTDITDIDYFIKCYNVLINISEKFDNIEYLNFGGGFGVSEDGSEHFNIAEYNKRVTDLMAQTSRNKDKSIHMVLEPGRIIGGAAGYFVCHVTDIKEREDQILVGVNASTAQFSRPLLYPDSTNHPVSVVRDSKLLKPETTQNTTIYGSSTYSRDIFAKNLNLPKLKKGDIIILGNAGSYSSSSYCEFLGFEKPEEVFI